MRIEHIELKKGAVLIADVHYKKGDVDFLALLHSWIESPPPQVFLLGDIFHLLLPFDYLIKYNIEAIELINTLSQKTEVYYTPGNHDFNISSIFFNVNVADAFVDKKKSIFLTHGDLTDKDIFYKGFSYLIRRNFLLKLINIVTFNIINGWFFEKLLKKMVKCSKIFSFKRKVKNKIADINYSIIIEGHYHQNVTYKVKDKTYINLGAFKCERVFYVYEKNNLKEKAYGGRR
ncbi:MAG: UDP-2,3-diacylglucosamine diphosphatase [Nautiliaceae bacterium]